jgi:hypothetical protein
MQIIKNNTDVFVVGGYISSMILYKSIVNLYVKSTYGNSSIIDAVKNVHSTRSKEVALFMLMGAPVIAGLMWTAGQIFRCKVVVNVMVNASNELNGIDSVSKTEIEGTSTISRDFLFLLVTKLPS